MNHRTSQRSRPPRIYLSDRGDSNSLDMRKSKLASPVVAREELENRWRTKVEQAKERYQVATKQYDKLLEESRGLTPAENSALLSARHEQSDALADLQRLLAIFTELTVDGRIPEEASTANAHGAE